jgi:hypothetical protein
MRPAVELDLAPPATRAVEATTLAVDREDPVTAAVQHQSRDVDPRDVLVEVLEAQPG